MADAACLLARLVLVDDGKGWRGDDFTDSELPAQCLDECRLAYSHLSVEGDDARRPHGGDELPCCLVNLSELFDRYSHVYTDLFCKAKNIFPNGQTFFHLFTFLGRLMVWAY